MKKLLIASAVFILPAIASAQNVGRCGWGSKLFDGQRGIAPQVLAVTTNGTSGNQTFGISSGTSGCTQDGVVRTNWRTAMFVGSNMNKLARDMSAGQGETMESLASLLEINGADKATFFSVSRENFASIFSSPAASSEEVLAALRVTMEANSDLAKYSANL